MHCDLCHGIENIRWTWLTPNYAAASLEQAKALGLFWAEDEEWAVCDDCHEDILADRPEAVRARAIATLGGNLTPHELDHMTTVHEAFWANKMTYYSGV